MKKLNLILLSASLSFSAVAGTESGGGGGVVWVDEGRPVLMDFFTILKSLNEIPYKNEESSRLLNSGEEFSITNENESQLRESNVAINDIIKTLETWSELPFDVMTGFVLGSMKSPLTWKFTDQELSAPAFYLAKDIPADKRIEVAAFYSDAKVKINRSIWNKLNLLDQKALIIHETLRQVQIGYKQDYDDESLQRATAIYTLCKPSGRLNYYMYYLLNNSPEMADKIYGSFGSFISANCKRDK